MSWAIPGFPMRRVVAAVIALWLVFAPAGALARADQLVRSTDGTVLAVHEWGDRARPTLILLHGFLQSHLAWERQFAPLSREFHVVAFDLRGHGASDKPVDAASYRDSWRWADDVAAVVRATSSRRPVLVGWSMGGRVILDYIEKYGQADIGGIVFVDAGLSRAAGMSAPANARLVAGLGATDLGEEIASTTAFLHACFQVQPTPEEFGRMLAYNMVVPPNVRTFLMGRPLDFDRALAAITAPTLVIQGERDALIPIEAARYTARQVPGAQLLVYPAVGHSSFYEAADRFNADLARFAKKVMTSGTAR